MNKTSVPRHRMVLLCVPDPLRLAVEGILSVDVPGSSSLILGSVLVSSPWLSQNKGPQSGTSHPTWSIGWARILPISGKRSLCFRKLSTLDPYRDPRLRCFLFLTCPPSFSCNVTESTLWWSGLRGRKPKALWIFIDSWRSLLRSLTWIGPSLRPSYLIFLSDMCWSGAYVRGFLSRCSNTGLRR